MDAARQRGMTIADWLTEMDGAHGLKRLHQAKPGGIIILHGNEVGGTQHGTKGGILASIQAAKSKGFSFHSLSDMSTVGTPILATQALSRMNAGEQNISPAEAQKAAMDAHDGGSTTTPAEAWGVYQANMAAANTALQSGRFTGPAPGTGMAGNSGTTSSAPASGPQAGGGSTGGVTPVAAVSGATNLAAGAGGDGSVDLQNMFGDLLKNHGSSTNITMIVQILAVLASALFQMLAPPGRNGSSNILALRNNSGNGDNTVAQSDSKQNVIPGGTNVDNTGGTTIGRLSANALRV